MTDPAQAVCELARVVRPGGVVAVLVPAIVQMPARDARFALRQWADEHQLSGYARAALMQWLSVARRLDSAQVQDWFHQAGLTDIQTQSHIAGRILSVRGRR